MSALLVGTSLTRSQCTCPAAGHRHSGLYELLGRGHDPVLLEPVEQLEEAGERRSVAGEPGGPAAGEVGEALHVAAEVAVGVPPRRDAVQVVLAQLLACGELGPHRCGTGHLLLEG